MIFKIYYCASVFFTFADISSSFSSTQSICLKRDYGEKVMDDIQHAKWDYAVRQELINQAIDPKEDFLM